MTHSEGLVADYIAAYNRFDVAGMTAPLSKDVIFENIQDGVVTLRTEGIEALRQQAETALTYFSARNQTILEIKSVGDTLEVNIAYSAVAAVDFPHGIRKGERLNLTGKSVFEFEDHRISRITDIV